MNLTLFNDWLSFAKKFSRTEADAEDLLQDCLIIAFEREKLDFSIEDNRKWFTGVLKKRAASLTRSQSRRVEREKKLEAPSSLSPPSHHGDASSHTLSELLSPLPRSARTTLALILAGLNRDEVCSALQLTSTSLRQRLTAIRKVFKKLPDDFRKETLAIAYQRKKERAENLEFGLIRRALRQSLSHNPGIGTHDPDGHLFIIKTK